jgi:hypothetical protein
MDRWGWHWAALAWYWAALAWHWAALARHWAAMAGSRPSIDGPVGMRALAHFLFFFL